MSEATLIQNRIDDFSPGTLFIPADFLDIASKDNTSQVLSRLVSSKEIDRVRRGVYEKPKISAVLKTNVAPSPDELAQTIARQNRWIIAPAGDCALNVYCQVLFDKICIRFSTLSALTCKTLSKLTFPQVDCLA